MPTYTTPAPIVAQLSLLAAAVRINANGDGETTVDVRPSDPASESDVRLANQTRVEFAEGRLLVKTPKRPRFLGRGGSIDVTIGLPAGSQLESDAAVAELRCDGRLGACRIKLAQGDTRIEETGALRLSVAQGDVSVDRATGHVEITTASGELRVGTIEGTAELQNASGDIRVDAVARDVKATTAKGDITIGSAGGVVEALAAHGDVRVAAIARDRAVLRTGIGTVEVGIRAGTAAWLDVRADHGRVHNTLEASPGPDRADATVEVRARSSYGDVVIRRA